MTNRFEHIEAYIGHKWPQIHHSSIRSNGNVNVKFHFCRNQQIITSNRVNEWHKTARISCWFDEIAWPGMRLAKWTCLYAFISACGECQCCWPRWKKSNSDVDIKCHWFFFSLCSFFFRFKFGSACSSNNPTEKQRCNL